MWSRRTFTTWAAWANALSDVAALERQAEGLVGPELGVEQRSARLEAASGSATAGSGFVFDFNQLSRILREGRGLGHDRGDGHSHGMHDPIGKKWMKWRLHPGEQPQVGDLAQRTQILRREDADDAGRPPRGLDAKGLHPGVSMGASEKDELREARKLQIVDVAPPAGDEPGVFRSLERSADIRAGIRHRSPSGVEAPAVLYYGARSLSRRREDDPQRTPAQGDRNAQGCDG